MQSSWSKKAHENQRLFVKTIKDCILRKMNESKEFTCNTVRTLNMAKHRVGIRKRKAKDTHALIWRYIPSSINSVCTTSILPLIVSHLKWNMTGMGNICFFSPLVLSNERFLSFLSLYTFWGKCDPFFNFWTHNYVKQNITVNFIIQKLKNKHIFLKNIQTEKAEEPFILTEREETKTRYFPPKWE